MVLFVLQTIDIKGPSMVLQYLKLFLHVDSFDRDATKPGQSAPAKIPTYCLPGPALHFRQIGGNLPEEHVVVD